MSYKKSKYFLTSNKRKIKYLFLNKKSQITVVFFHGFMSDMVGEKPNTIQKFCTKKKMGFLKFEYSGHGKSSEKFRKNFTKNTFLKSESTTYGMNNFDIVSIMNFGLLEF